jgi:putative flippase GtrA
MNPKRTTVAETGLAALWAPSGTLVGQFARYLVVGGVAFCADFGLLYLLTSQAGVQYLISAAIAFLFGLAINYALSRIWVFNKRVMSNGSLEFLVFSVIGVVGLGFNEAMMWAMHELLHLHYLMAKVVSAAVVLLWNFGARKLMLFR